jgi:hypothetical protein
MFRGKQLLAALVEQKDYIFVTSQVVDEVSRNKVKVAASFSVRGIVRIANQQRKSHPREGAELLGPWSAI